MNHERSVRLFDRARLLVAGGISSQIRVNEPADVPLFFTHARGSRMWDVDGNEYIDYIQGMGVTAIWFAPIFKNKPVQGPLGNESAGYHGYWVTDFTSVDPHLGTNAEFKAFVDAAHARGMKVYMDIITNHTADVIQYAGGDYAYRSKADYPFSTLGGPEGERINPDFAGDDDHSPENWAKLTDPRFAYTPVVPEAERDIKVPAWLNDPIYYHNRGNSEWWGESAVYGDFAGLDDLATEHPRVLAGMIDIFGSWIDRFGIDGFRIDTVKHVNPEFWQAFVPAMQARAEAKAVLDGLEENTEVAVALASLERFGTGTGGRFSPRPG